MEWGDGSDMVVREGEGVVLGLLLWWTVFDVEDYGEVDGLWK